MCVQTNRLTHMHVINKQECLWICGKFGKKKKSCALHVHFLYLLLLFLFYLCFTMPRTPSRPEAASSLNMLISAPTMKSFFAAKQMYV